MSLRDSGRRSWLDAERALVAAALRAGVPVLGICLGAQLLAQLLGARVLRNGHGEIGWFPVIVDEALEATWLSGVLPQQLESFFWHEDTFELPDGAIPVASTRACRNQGFVWGRHLALQFHLEVTPEWAAHLARRDADQLVADEFVQTADSILSRPASLYDRNNAVMDRLLARWLTADPPVG
jgi:GMP synthase-like glutamine amidotransferase